MSFFLYFPPQWNRSSLHPPAPIPPQPFNYCPNAEFNLVSKFIWSTRLEPLLALS